MQRTAGPRIRAPGSAPGSVPFLKFLDDLELQREEEAKLAGKKFRPANEPPYRWRDWASNPQGVTGDERLSFINLEKGIRPDGKEGAGLFAYMRNLTSSNGDDRRNVIATVFRGVNNRMKSGYLLRDVIDQISGIHFTSSAELHTLSTLYESMLREMRDAAGDSGEIYTPRPVVRFMVMMLDPYTSIPANLLFFDRSGSTKDVWYYEHPLPDGRKNYTKTAPLQFEEFAACQAWWTKREENDRAWKVSAAELLANGCNLDRKNPQAKEDIAHLPPDQLAASILQKELRIAEIMGNIRTLLAKGPTK